MDRKLTDAGFTEQRFNTGEINLNYAVGPNHGPALVLVPAQMGNWESYLKVLLPLSQRFHVFAVDVRGRFDCGNSPLTVATLSNILTNIMYDYQQG